ncbi:hypothetical protein [Kocuria massiliensis]|uniref:hypothetical protein n=1 Tax=Kocuria massiliensis TaxID=1926282 RepID=UPI000A1CDCF1|nr:hypothetical protein [Kocuria massiliensis]
MKPSITDWIDTHLGLTVTLPIVIIIGTGFSDIAVWISQPGYTSIVDGRPMPAPADWFAHLLAEPFDSPGFTIITIVWIVLNVLMLALLVGMVGYDLYLSKEAAEDMPSGPFDPAEDQGL